MSEGFAAIPNSMFRGGKVSRNGILVYGALASHSGYGGIFPSQETLAEETQLSVRTVRVGLGELTDLGVIERVRRRAREGKSTAMTTGYVLHPNGPAQEVPAMAAGSSVKVPATDDIATGRIAQVTPLIEEEPFKKSDAVASSAKGTRLSPDWVPSQQSLKEGLIKAPSVNLLVETENFVDYWVARPGAGGLKLDWDRTWRTWMRRAHERNVERGWRPALVAVSPVVGEEWLQTLRIPVEEYLERRDEPGWVDQMKALAAARG